MSQEGLRLLKVLSPLAELQQLAYAQEDSRTPKAILRAYNAAFLFFIHLTELMPHNDENNCRSQGIYGELYHYF